MGGEEGCEPGYHVRTELEEVAVAGNTGTEMR